MSRRTCLLVWLALGALSGCAHRMRSSMYLPCKMREISVSEEVYGATEETWVASCKGHDYGCWATAQGNKVKYGCKAMRSSAKRTARNGNRAATDAGS
jgi:hypothetical protein